VVVGLSGGADSVCLLLILKEACKETGVTLVAVHVNHGIRGEEANRDEAFCKRLCEENNIVFKAYKFSVPDIAKEQKLGLEEAGRMVRYQSFYEAAGENGVVAVAHHQNDQAETVLFNIARGSRLKGAVGMMPVRDRIIRPLLCVTRSEIEAYLKENGVEFCTDSTNLGNDYSRNSIRNQVMPLLNEINPKATAHFADFAAGALEAESFLEEYTCSCFLEKSKNLKDKILLDIKGVHSYIVGRLIRMVFEKLEVGLKDITKKHVDEIVMLSSKRVGANKHIKSGVWVENTRDGLLFYKEISRLYFSKLKVGGAIIFEIGSTQSEAVSEILRDAGYSSISVFSDFGGNMRAVMAYRL
jgi:tRNA(Ile)-lysidine synthase